MRRKLLILNLEDSALDSEIIEAMLTEDGLDFSLVRVENKRDFVSALEGAGAGLVLADYSLPSFDGLSALKITLEKRPDIPFIFVSGAIGEDFAVEMLKNGATDYVLKNRMSRLAPAVRRALQSARERVERGQAREELRKYRERLEHLVKDRTSALYESEKRYRLLFENANEAIFIIDAEGENAGRIVDANGMAAKMHGYSLRELLELSMEDVDSHEDAGRGPSRRALILKGEWVKAELAHSRKDGSVFPVEISTGLFAQEGHKYIFTIAREITERKKAEEKIKSSLLEKEILLKELYHRTKNNMQVISGLLSLESMAPGDKGLQTIFKETQDRIRAMSLVHEKLYKSQDLSNLDVKEYIEDLCMALMESYSSEKVSLQLDVQRIPLSIELATPCGLIINELLSNSLKHAFAGTRKGEIRIAMNKEGEGGISLVYSDNGVGLPPGLDPANTKTLGLRLVNNLVLGQLEGKLEVCHGNGTGFRIKFQRDGVGPEKSAFY